MPAIIRTVGRRLSGEDSTVPGGMAPGQDVYVGYTAGGPGYRAGRFNDYAAVKAAFPGKLYLSVGLDVIDIEPMLANPPDAVGFIDQWKPVNTNKPVLYADRSQMPDVINAVTAAGIPRSSYYLWLAAPNGSAPIPAGYDGLQWAFGNSEDSDYFYDYMWAKPAPPPPPADPNHLNIDGYLVRRPGNGIVPAVVSWWGTSGLTTRQSNIPESLWAQLKWAPEKK